MDSLQLLHQLRQQTQQPYTLPQQIQQQQPPQQLPQMDVGIHPLNFNTKLSVVFQQYLQSHGKSIYAVRMVCSVEELFWMM